jgi:hypothetical protein
LLFLLLSWGLWCSLFFSLLPSTCFEPHIEWVTGRLGLDDRLDSSHLEIITVFAFLLGLTLFQDQGQWDALPSVPLRATAENFWGSSHFVLPLASQTIPFPLKSLYPPWSSCLFSLDSLYIYKFWMSTSLFGNSRSIPDFPCLIIYVSLTGFAVEAADRSISSLSPLKTELYARE